MDSHVGTAQPETARRGSVSLMLNRNQRTSWNTLLALTCCHVTCYRLKKSESLTKRSLFFYGLGNKGYVYNNLQLQCFIYFVILGWILLYYNKFNQEQQNIYNMVSSKLRLIHIMCIGCSVLQQLAKTMFGLFAHSGGGR